MDPRLLRYYNQELQHLREMGAEFAKQFPKIAGRLGVEGMEVTDPYVERLMEGVGFLAARVQLKLDAEFPRFTQQLLEMLYPHYLAPTPSMLIAQFQPVLSEGALAAGVKIERGSAIHSRSPKPDATTCEFRTAHELTLWPIELVEARFFSFAADLPLATLPVANKIRGGVRLKLRSTGGAKFRDIRAESLRFFLGGADEVAHKLQELIGAASLGALVNPGTRPMPWYEYLPPEAITSVGFEDEQAQLPEKHRSFSGYRLLQEYFSFPQRFMFFDLNGLAPAFARQDAAEIEIVLLFGRGDAVLENVVDAGNFMLNCTPAINLFPKRIDRINVADNANEFHVLADRTRPLDFEIHTLTEVSGFGAGADSERRFLPFYADFHSAEASTQAYYTLHREPRLYSDTQRRHGARSSYIGSEVFIKLVDPREAPFSENLRQLSMRALCTNRDLPLLMPIGMARSDFDLELSAPVEAVRCVKGPSKPYSALAEGAIAWRFISHLTLNYLSLADKDPLQGANALREMLELYASTGDIGMKRQIDGLKSVAVRQVTRRLPMPGPLCFGRGQEISLMVDELAFEGGSAYLLGSVLEHFLARHASLNSFTETVLHSLGRGEIMRWSPRCGQRAIL